MLLMVVASVDEGVGDGVIAYGMKRTEVEGEGVVDAASSL